MSSSPRVLVLHGPLLNLERVLGKSLEAFDEELAEKATTLGFTLETFQASAEATLVDALLEKREGLAAVIVNPSSLAPTAYTLADALAALELPCIEVQLAHEAKARGRSALRRVVDKQFHGKGLDGYVKALEALSKRAPVVKADEATDDADDETADETEAVSAPPRTVKTIGRKPAALVSTAQAPSKTIGRKPAPPAGAKSLGRGEGPKPGAPATGTITKALVREQLQARLGKKVSPDEFAQWARAQWAAIQRGTPAEHPALEDVLLLLSTSAKASDHVILSYAAKLES